MLNPRRIIHWLRSRVKGMRLSRLKTLGNLVAAAAKRRGCGVLSLGRAQTSRSSAKHGIKKTWRFLRNSDVESTAVHRTLLRLALPRRGPAVALADWTDLHPYRVLLLAVARDGRALPFYSRTIRKGVGERLMVAAEGEAVERLEEMLPGGQEVVVTADRGFGCRRWMELVSRRAGRGWSFVQRLGKGVTVYTGEHYCRLGDLPVTPGQEARDRGLCTLGEGRPLSCRLVTVWSSGSAEPWYLATNRDGEACEVVGIYRRRMWIEAMIRDLKSRKWGLGLDEVRLSEAARHDRHLLILFLAYILLSGFGLVAEQRGIAARLKANTVSERVLSLAAIGFLALGKLRCSIGAAIRGLSTAPT
jgi:hypothetical protein